MMTRSKQSGKPGQGQFALAQHGFFVRGGLTCGLVYMGDDFVFGPGLIEAIEIESRIAVQPRVVLSKAAVRRVRKHLRYYADSSEAPDNRRLLISDDGEVFLNYLSVCEDYERDDGLDPHDELVGHKEAIENRLDQWMTNRHVWSKYRWLGDYHNYFCRTNFPEESELLVESDIAAVNFKTLADVFYGFGKGAPGTGASMS